MRFFSATARKRRNAYSSGGAATQRQTRSQQKAHRDGEGVHGALAEAWRVLEAPQRLLRVGVHDLRTRRPASTQRAKFAPRTPVSQRGAATVTTAAYARMCGVGRVLPQVCWPQGFVGPRRAHPVFTLQPRECTRECTHLSQLRSRAAFLDRVTHLTRISRRVSALLVHRTPP